MECVANPEAIGYNRHRSKSGDVLEEMYHAEHDRENLFGKILTDEVLLRREIDAQRYLISLTKRYKIPAEEVELTKRNLALYEQELKDLLERNE